MTTFRREWSHLILNTMKLKALVVFPAMRLLSGQLQGPLTTMQICRTTSPQLLATSSPHRHAHLSKFISEAAVVLIIFPSRICTIGLTSSVTVAALATVPKPEPEVDDKPAHL